MRRRTLVIATVTAVLFLAACGSGDDSAENRAGDTPGERTVEVVMTDSAFEPATVTVARGDKVRFRFTNNGTLAHDAFIGDVAAQADHEDEMRSGGMHHGGSSEEALTLQPEEDGTLSHRFDEAGPIEIGCHQPGHYAAGMKVSVTVT